MSEPGFEPGDIVVHGGETYQVLEDYGDSGRVAPFPAEGAASLVLHWDAGGERCRRIGHEPLPAPAPCSIGAGCPGESQPLNQAPRPRGDLPDPD